MASLPPGWEADYDGRRWFFTYGPTGQSQFHFPRPGDEFPDILCAAGATSFPAAELTPEERLESGRQVRRLLLSAAGAAGDAVDAGEEEEVGPGGGRAGPPVRGGGGDGESNVCFESFAAVGSRRGQISGGGREGNGAVGQGERGVGDGAGVPVRMGVAGPPEQSTGEPVSAPVVTKGEHARADSPPARAADSPAAISVMSEPVLAAAETTAAAPSRGHRGEQRPAAVARPSSREAATLERLAVDAAQTALPGPHADGIPELYSESTALCEHEINPPPVELPANEGSRDGHPAGSDPAIHDPVALPAHEEPRGVGPERGSSPAQVEQKESCAPPTSGRDHAVASDFGPGGAPGPKDRAHDRAGLPSQASRVATRIPPCTAPRGDGVSSARDQEHSHGGANQPAGAARAERRDMAHCPSVLRPGPRRSSQPQVQQPGAPATSTPRAARVQPHQQPQEEREQRQREKVGSGVPSREQPARMPTMPLVGHPRDVPTTSAPTGSPSAAPRPGGVWGFRMPDAADFVVPVQHIPRAAEPRLAGEGVAAQEGRPPRYRSGVSSAPARAVLAPRPARLANAESAGEVPEWSWGYAR